MEEQLLRAVAALQSSTTEVSASVRALEKAVLALVVLHPHRSQLIDLTEYLLRTDAILGKTSDRDLISCYVRHGARLTSEMRSVRSGT